MGSGAFREGPPRKREVERYSAVSCVRYAVVSLGVVARVLDKKERVLRLPYERTDVKPPVAWLNKHSW